MFERWPGARPPILTHVGIDRTVDIKITWTSTVFEFVRLLNYLGACGSIITEERLE